MMQKTLASLTLLVLSAVSTPSLAQTIPFRGGGQSATFNPNTGEYLGTGLATHMGRCVLDGQIAFTPTASDANPPFPIFLNGTFSGEQDLIAANGDKMHCSVNGTVTLYFDPATGLAFGTWLPTFEIIEGSTGRFENASGKFTGTAINPPFFPFALPLTNPPTLSDVWPFDWQFSGKIDLGKKKGRKK